MAKLRRLRTRVCLAGSVGEQPFVGYGGPVVAHEGHVSIVSQVSPYPVPVRHALITEQLLERPTATPDYRREKLALQDLARLMADRPAQVLPRLVNLALEFCEADLRV